MCWSVCLTSFPSKSPTAADESSWAALKHSRFQNYFTLEFFSTFQKVQLQQIRAADTFRFFNFGWDDLVDSWKEGRMDGRMVPRRIMVFVFRLCRLGIILPSLEKIWHLGFYFSFIEKWLRGEALAKFLGKARFGHYEFNGRGPMLWEAFVFPKNRFKVLPKLGVGYFYPLKDNKMLSAYHTDVIIDEMLYIIKAIDPLLCIVEWK